MKIYSFIIGLFIINTALAGGSDTCREDKVVMKCETEMICANIIFPQMLCGNENNAMDYIVKFSDARRRYIINMFNKSRNYFPKVTAVLKKYGVPQEFWVLMALESAFNPKAVSKAGAVGFWQFMDPVAKEYGLKIGQAGKVAETISKKHHGKKLVIAKSKVQDERMHFLKSTVAAARYLKDRSRNLNNDILLIAASYNWGVGNVWNAMERTGKENPTFWDIKKFLPQETFSYVMNFITLNVIYNNYDQFMNGTLVFHDKQAEAMDDSTSVAGL